MGLFNKNNSQQDPAATEETVVETAAETAQDAVQEAAPYAGSVPQPEPEPKPEPEPEKKPEREGLFSRPAKEPEPQPEPKPELEPEKKPEREGLFSRPVTEQDVAAVPGPDTLEERERHSKRMQLLKTGDIFWSWVLMSIPVIGWIVAIVWAAGLCRKRQRKFLARAFLIHMLVSILLFIIAYAVYTLIFRYKFEDLPMVLTNIWDWFWGGIISIFKKN